jgi:hypothetical protein
MADDGPREMTDAETAVADVLRFMRDDGRLPTGVVAVALTPEEIGDAYDEIQRRWASRELSYPEAKGRADGERVGAFWQAACGAGMDPAAATMASQTYVNATAWAEAHRHTEE